MTSNNSLSNAFLIGRPPADSEEEYRCGAFCDVDQCIARVEPSCVNRTDIVTLNNIRQGVCLNGHCYDIDTIRRLMETGIDPISRFRFTFPELAEINERNTALIAAAENGDAESVRLLLDAGADMNATNNDGDTALILAAVQGHAEIVRLLLDRGANVEATDSDGYTAFIVAAASSHAEIVRLLLDRGADINATNHDGNTSLIEAAQNGYADIVRLLLDRGANVEATDNDGHTALRYAAQIGHAEIVRLILASVQAP